MSRPNRRKRAIRLWIGIVFLSISALFWLILVIVIVAEPEEGPKAILSGLVLSNIPLGVDIYYVRRGKRRYKGRVFYGQKGSMSYSLLLADFIHGKGSIRCITRTDCHPL